ncbi:hypothetical protein CA11_46840 [Gimesia maris]|uniref:SUKH-4 family immunity protein n=1 Tax=Gimesia maris TaxID=122 RepID=UPI00118AED5D|nr:SUKH-4 family immunity protein [Gimesia maris]QDU16848.1 hypothetical protein CA11_46840 [Gimesia maris]
MSPESFCERWCDDEDEVLIAFPAQSVAGLSIPETSREFLTSAGLPDSAAPFLDFQAPEAGLLPDVSDLWNQDSAFRRFRIIGSNESGDPVCLDEAENGLVVYLNHDLNFKPVLINSSITALAESLLIYRQFVRDCQEQNGEDAWLDCDISEALLVRLNHDLTRIDSTGISPGCFWSMELERLRESDS